MLLSHIPHQTFLSCVICSMHINWLINVCIVVGVEEATDRDRADPEFLKILELHTAQLERRVRACQARIMLVTCFDTRVWLV